MIFANRDFVRNTIQQPANMIPFLDFSLNLAIFLHLTDPRSEIRQDDVTVSSGKDTVQLTIPMLVKRRNGRKIILAPGGMDAIETEKDESNVTAKKLAQAHRLVKMIENGKYSTRTMLAEELGLDPSNVVKTLNRLNLLPKIRKMIVEDNLPAVMTLTLF